jgi:hypothetical protein
MSRTLTKLVQVQPLALMKKWFAGALGTKLKEKENVKADGSYPIVTFIPEPSQPLLFSLFFDFFDAYSQRKGEICFVMFQQLMAVF